MISGAGSWDCGLTIARACAWTPCAEELHGSLIFIFRTAVSAFRYLSYDRGRIGDGPPALECLHQS